MLASSATYMNSKHDKVLDSLWHQGHLRAASRIKTSRHLLVRLSVVAQISADLGVNDLINWPCLGHSQISFILACFLHFHSSLLASYSLSPLLTSCSLSFPLACFLFTFFHLACFLFTFFPLACFLFTLLPPCLLPVHFPSPCWLSVHFLSPCWLPVHFPSPLFASCYFPSPLLASCSLSFVLASCSLWVTLCLTASAALLGLEGSSRITPLTTTAGQNLLSKSQLVAVGHFQHSVDTRVG